MGIKCFLLEPTGRWRVWLRRYHSSAEKCPGEFGYHNAMTLIGDFTGPEECEVIPGGCVDHADPRWPAKCSCGYEFAQDDAWQLFRDTLWKRDTGEIYTLRDAPVGAMWYADWFTHPSWIGPDGRSLWVKVPGGDWCPDSRASNCTLPEDNDHKCWIRHGTPPLITVDKAGRTCGAGAGSIQMKNWHGWLRNGELVT